MVDFNQDYGPEAREEFDAESDAEFQQMLRDALRARAAPSGFAERVMARAHSQPRRRGLAQFPSSLRAIAAVVLLSIAVGGYFVHQHQRRIAGERARQQVLLALRITSTTLQDVRNRINRTGGQTQ